MKKISYAAFTIIVLLTSFFQPAEVQAASLQSSEEPYSGEALCAPGIYPNGASDCLVMGPAQLLTDYAAQGITFPEQPLPIYHIPADLGTVSYQYAKLSSEAFPVYSSPADAAARNVRRIMDAGLKYMSYTADVENEAGRFFQMRSGEWVDGYYIARATPPEFQGYLFRETPPTNFGWILQNAESFTQPGYNQPATGRSYVRFNLVHIYATQKADGVDWVQIGPSEWVEKRLVACVLIDPTKPEGVNSDRWISIDLYEQTLSVYENGQIVFATLVSTGVDPFFTQPGVFQIYKKKEAETMSGAFSADRSDYYYLEDVPWTMYFDKARALHGAYWHSLFGYMRSHGCVNMSIADSHWLYDWAVEGDYVYVFDPSGQTPTDPAYYSDGGA